MPQITLATADAAELAQTLTFPTNWLTGTGTARPLDRITRITAEVCVS